MRRPATFGNVLSATALYLAGVQLATLGVLALVKAMERFLRAGGDVRAAWPTPEAIVLWIGVPLALAAVAVAWVQFRRGDLDVYDVRRRRAH